MIQRPLTFDLKLSTRASRGFTLVELLVTIGIFMMLTGVVLAKYRTFDTNAKFANASEDVVLALRQAQVYGVGVKQSPGCLSATNDVFKCAYGVYFANGANGLKVFSDINPGPINAGNKVFDEGEDTGLASLASNWGSAISIDNLSCGGNPCTNGVSVTFIRPNPDGFIADVANSAISYDFATIRLKDSNTLKTTTITITKAGQISLQ